jgi:hypothetical protein
VRTHAPDDSFTIASYGLVRIAFYRDAEKETLQGLPRAAPPVGPVAGPGRLVTETRPQHRARPGRRLVTLTAACTVALGVLAAGCVVVTPPPSDTLAISTSPGLFPSFSPSISDYVVRCDASTPVTVSVAAPSGTLVSVDGQPAAGGSFADTVTRDVGQSFSFTVQSPSVGQRWHPNLPSKPPVTYYVRCLPSNFPSWTVQTNGTPQAQWYLTVPATGANYPTIFDAQGVPVWWGPDTGTVFAELLSDGNIAWTSEAGAPAEEHALDGSLVRTITNTLGVPNDQHDLLLLPNGDYVIVADTVKSGVDLSGLCSTPSTCGPSNTSVLDPVIQEVTPGGALVWSWDTADHLPASEMDPQWYQQYITGGSAPYDVYHWNSVEYTGSGFILSFRHLDAVYDIDQASGSTLWKLGDSQGTSGLTVQGDPVFDGGSHFGGQHDARLLPDGTVTVHDDGTNLGRSPRAVRYSIDTLHGTATYLESVSDPLVTSAPCCGSARKLPGGDWVIGWGGSNTITELAPDGTRPFLVQFQSGTLIYRVVPILPGVLSAATLRSAMDAQYATSSSAHAATAPRPAGLPPGL